MRELVMLSATTTEPELFGGTCSALLLGSIGHPIFSSFTFSAASPTRTPKNLVFRH